ncbi:MAG: DUF6568 family protein [Bacilli bacterium]
METKKITVKNYLLLLALFVFTLLCFYFLVINYNKNKEALESGNSTMDFLLQVTTEDLKSYIYDNHDAIIYMSNSTDESLINYETRLKKLIIVKELDQDIIYFDMSKVDEIFYSSISDKYFTETILKQNISINYSPNLIIIKEGKISNILYSSNIEVNDLEASDVIRFIENNF